jgi:hypothetical protein
MELKHFQKSKKSNVVGGKRMKDTKLNEAILTAIREDEKVDKPVKEFLIDLIYEETKSPGQYKDIYRKKVNQYSK